jgi:carboxymethylenebutenolidase
MKRLLAFILASLAASVAIGAAAAPPATVYFPSRDGKAELVGYLFEAAAPGRHPAIVLLHGRAGPYSSNVNASCTDVGRGKSSPCNATTLSERHKAWGEYWTAHGYVALLVDSFGPRGRAHGYGRGTHDDTDREDVNERTVRPLDAEGALAYLAQRNDVDPGRIMLQGWSNGASTTLNAMYRQAQEGHAGGPRFRAALVFYPGCGSKALLSQRYVSDARIWVFLASDDEEVSPKICADVLGRATPPGLVDVTMYEGATHDFDDPGKTRQAVAGNRVARADAMGKAAALLEGAP